MKNTKTKGNLMLILTAFIWGIAFIAQSVGVETLSANTFNGVRSTLGGIGLIPVILILDSNKKKNGITVPKPNKTLLFGGIICGIFLCAASTVQTAAMAYTSPGKAGFITALYMILVPIISVFAGKKITYLNIISVVVATVGLYLICVTDGFGSINKGDIMLFICALLFSFHIIAVDYFSPKTDGVKLSCIQFFVCGVINLTWAFIFDKPQLKPILDCWIPICYAGFFSCGIAYTLQIVGQKYTDPTSASILMSMESVFSMLATVALVACGFNLTGGALTAREIFGCALMFCAIILVQLPDKKKTASQSKQA